MKNPIEIPMRSTVHWCVACVLALGAALPLSAATEGGAVPPGFQVEVEIEPHPSHAGGYEARAEVIDLASGEVVAGPRVLFLRGPEGGGTIRTGTAGGLEVIMTFEVDEAGESATCDARILRGEELLFAYLVRVRLVGKGTGE